MDFFGVGTDHNSLPRRFKPRPFRMLPPAPAAAKCLAGMHPANVVRRRAVP